MYTRYPQCNYRNAPSCNARIGVPPTYYGPGTDSNAGYPGGSGGSGGSGDNSAWNGAGITTGLAPEKDYIEIDSSFRDRTKWPHPSEFDVVVTGNSRNSANVAADPVSHASVEKRWRGYRFAQNASGPTINVAVRVAGPGAAGLSATTDHTTLIIDTLATDASGSGALQPIHDYYVGAVIAHRTDPPAPAGTSTLRARIVGYKYLGIDRGMITIDRRVDAFEYEGKILEIADPTDLTSKTHAFVFVPHSKDDENAYIRYRLYNETRHESVRVVGFDATTRLLSLESNPITGWLPTDTYTLREDDPVLCTTLVNPDPSNTTFLLPATTEIDNLDGAWLQKVDDLTGGRDTGALTSAQNAIATYGLSPTASSVDGFYNGSTIRITSGPAAGEIRAISKYTGGLTAEVVTDGPFYASPNVGDTYYIDYAYEAQTITKFENYQGELAAVGTAPVTFIVFPLSAKSTKNVYTNLYIRITSGAAAGDIRLITDYRMKTLTGTGTTNGTAEVDAAFSPGIAAGDTFSIVSGTTSPFRGPLLNNDVCLLQFGHDNMNPLMSYFRKDLLREGRSMWTVKLVHVVLPNKILKVPRGYYASRLPYVYVSLSNAGDDSAFNRNPLFTNNYGSRNMLFRALIENPGQHDVPPYVVARGDGMVQPYDFKADIDLTFKVRVPGDGYLFKTMESEWFGPTHTNPDIQISALFEVSKR